MDDNPSTLEDTEIVFDILGNDTAAPNNIDPATVDLDPSSPLTEDKNISNEKATFPSTSPERSRLHPP